MSTDDIDREVNKFIIENKGTPAPLGYRGFPKSICSSINEVICHGIPKKSDVLYEGDIVKLDIAVILDGFFGDICRTYSIGSVSDQVKKLLEVAEQCLYLGILQVKPDREFGMIGKAISSYAKSKGFSVVHQFAGHGVGLNFHEEPNISHDDKRYDSRKMKSGMIFTIEPMINEGVSNAIIDETDKWTARTADGKLSAQFEDTVLVTDYGVEILTR